MKTYSKTQNAINLLVTFAILFFVTAGCNPSSKESNAAFDLINAKKEIEAANQDFMALFSKGDSVGLTDLYAADAKLMMTNAPAIAGKSNIQSAFSSFIKSGIAKVELKTIDVWGTSDLLTEEGEMALTSGDGKQVEKGKYLVVWKKEDNKWKILRDMSNSDLPMPASK